MTRTAIALIAVLWLATPAWAQHGDSSCGYTSPSAFGQQTQASMDEDGFVSLRRSDLVYVCELQTRQERRTRLVTVDGVQKEEAFTVDVQMCVMKPIANSFQSRVALDKIQAYDMSAKRITEERLAEALEKETTVLLADRKVPAYYLAVYKPDTLLLVVKPQDLYGSPVGYAPSVEGGEVTPPPADGDAPMVVAPMAPVRVPAPAPRPEILPGAAPRVAMAQSKDGKVSLRSYLKDVTKQTVQGETRENGVTKKVQFEVETESVNDTEVKYPERAVRLQRADGKPVDANDAGKLLATYRNVLVSTDGKDVNPAYLKIVRPDALIIIAPIPSPTLPGGVVAPAPAPMAPPPPQGSSS